MYKTRVTKALCFLIVLLMLLMGCCFGNAERDNSWDCPNCGRTGNIGNFCGECAYPAPVSEPAELQKDNIPVLSQLFSGIQTHLVGREERWYSQYGPGNDYAKTSDGYKTDSKHSNAITVFFCENDWVFANIVYSTASEKYAYLPLRSIADPEHLPIISALDYIDGITNTDTIPCWGPEISFIQDKDCKIATDTPVKVFFIENDYAYCEFSCAKGKVRMWLPLDDILFL